MPFNRDETYDCVVAQKIVFIRRQPVDYAPDALLDDTFDDFGDDRYANIQIICERLVIKVPGELPSWEYTSVDDALEYIINRLKVLGL